MRQAICALFFDELDAHRITSDAYADNPASAAVSRKVGYAPNGTNLELRENAAALHHKFILDRKGFIRPRHQSRSLAHLAYGRCSTSDGQRTRSRASPCHRHVRALPLRGGSRSG